MRIEAFGPEGMMEELRFHLEDQLEKAGYKEGPKVGYMDGGIMISYSKADQIISLQLSQESEEGECCLSVEAEQEIPELNTMWDDALISFGKEFLGRLHNLAIDKNKVDQGLR